MNNRRISYIISIFCIIIVILSITLSACNKNDNIQSDEIKKFITTDGLLNFDELPESALAGEKISAEQWKDALKESNLDNVTIYWLEDDFDLTLESTSGYYKFDINAKNFEEKIKDLSMNFEHTLIATETNNQYYIFSKWTEDNNEDGWYRQNENNDEVSINFKNYIYEQLDDPDPTDFLIFADRFREFTYKDGFYCADKIFTEFFYGEASYWYNVKFSFKNGKLRMFTYEDQYYDGNATDTVTFVYTDYGTTKITIPENFTEYNENID